MVAVTARMPVLSHQLTKTLPLHSCARRRKLGGFCIINPQRKATVKIHVFKLMVHPILVPFPPLLVTPGPLTLPSPSHISGWDGFPSSEEGLSDYDEKLLHQAERVCFPSRGTIVGLLGSKRFCGTFLLMSKRSPPGNLLPFKQIFHPLPSPLPSQVLKGASTFYHSTFSLKTFQHHSCTLQLTETACLTVPFQLLF